MTYGTVLLEKHDGIAYLTLNRPEQANTINAQLSRDVNAALDDIASDGDSRVVILTGAGRHFCGGADLKEMANGQPRGRRTEVNFMTHLEQFELPVIAAINGAAVGGGCEIALCCDIRVMSSAAQIGLPEIKFGMLPLGGGTQRLPRLVGPGVAKELILTGLPLSADEAHRVGLVNRVAAPEDLLATSEEIARTLAGRARYALSAAKFLINEGMQANLETGLRLEYKIIARMATPAEMAAEQQRAASASGTYAKIFEKA